MGAFLLLFLAAVLLDAIRYRMPSVSLFDVCYYRNGERRKPAAKDHTIAPGLRVIRKYNCFQYLQFSDGSTRPLNGIAYELPQTDIRISGRKRFVPLVTILCTMGFLLQLISVPIRKQMQVVPFCRQAQFVACAADTMAHYECKDTLTDTNIHIEDAYNVLIAGIAGQSAEAKSTDVLLLLSVYPKTRNWNLISLRNDLLVEPINIYAVTWPEMLASMQGKDEAYLDQLKIAYPDTKILDMDMQLADTYRFQSGDDTQSDTEKIGSKLRSLKVNTEKAFCMQIDGAILIENAAFAEQGAEFLTEHLNEKSARSRQKILQNADAKAFMQNVYTDMDCKDLCRLLDEYVMEGYTIKDRGSCPKLYCYDYIWLDGAEYSYVDVNFHDALTDQLAALIK